MVDLPIWPQAAANLLKLRKNSEFVWTQTWWCLWNCISQHPIWPGKVKSRPLRLNMSLKCSSLVNRVNRINPVNVLSCITVSILPLHILFKAGVQDHMPSWHMAQPLVGDGLKLHHIFPPKETKRWKVTWKATVFYSACFPFEADCVIVLFVPPSSTSSPPSTCHSFWWAVGYSLELSTSSPRL